jgi:hypothetical protein
MISTSLYTSIVGDSLMSNIAAATAATSSSSPFAAMRRAADGGGGRGGPDRRMETTTQVGFHRHNVSGAGERSRGGGRGGGDVEEWGSQVDRRR